MGRVTVTVPGCIGLVASQCFFYFLVFVCFLALLESGFLLVSNVIKSGECQLE